MNRGEIYYADLSPVNKGDIDQFLSYKITKGINIQQQ